MEHIPEPAPDRAQASSDNDERPRTGYLRGMNQGIF
jgi:hypothetical protein